LYQPDKRASLVITIIPGSEGLSGGSRRRDSLLFVHYTRDGGVPRPRRLFHPRSSS
jgi:hypothetical protein